MESALLKVCCKLSRMASYVILATFSSSIISCFFRHCFNVILGKWHDHEKKKWFGGGWKKQQLNTVKLYSRKGKWKGLSIFNLTISKKSGLPRKFFHLKKNCLPFTCVLFLTETLYMTRWWYGASKLFEINIEGKKKSKNSPHLV